MTRKFCFLNSQRPCDLTCKAAFEVDDPVDSIDCHFVWLAFHFGEGLFDLRRMVEAQLGGAQGPTSGPPAKGPKGYPPN